MEKLTFTKVEAPKQQRLFENLLIDTEKNLRAKGVKFMWHFEDLVFDKLVDGGGEAYIGFLGEEPVTTIIGFDEDKNVWPDKVGVDSAMYLHKLTVRKGYGGKGFAQQTLQYMLDLAKKKGKTYLRFDCRNNRQKLKDLYLGFGMKIVGTRQMPFDKLALLEMKL